MLDLLSGCSSRLGKGRMASGFDFLRIVRAMITVSTMVGVVTLVYFAREIVIAREFGAGAEIEAFLIAFLVPMTVVNILRESLSLAVIPMFVQTREREGSGAAHQLFGQLTTLLALTVIGVTAALAISGPLILRVIASGFDSEKLALTRTLYFALLPIILFGGFSVLWAAILTAGERFAIAAIAPGFAPLLGLAGLLVSDAEWRIFALAGGTLFGAAMEAIVLGITLRSHVPSLLPRWRAMDVATRRTVGQYASVFAAIALAHLEVVISQGMAASLGPGQVAALVYGNKIVGSLCALGPSALGIAFIPFLSRFASDGDIYNLTRTVRYSCVVIVAVTLPLAIGVIMFSEPIVRIVFQRGAFTPEDTRIVSNVQAYYALTLPFFTLSVLGSRVLSASLRSIELSLVAALSTGLRVAFSIVLMTVLGVTGLALAGTLVQAVRSAMIFAAVFWTRPGRSRRSLEACTETQGPTTSDR